MLKDLVRVTKLSLVIAAAMVVCSPAKSLAVEYKAAASPDKAADVVFVAGKRLHCRCLSQLGSSRGNQGWQDNVLSATIKARFSTSVQKTKIQDLNGRMVLPGFHDSHVHLVDGGLALADCVLDDLPSKEAIFERIAQYSKEHKDDAWIRGSGWALPLFPEAGPTKEELDRIIPTDPHFFIRKTITLHG